GGGFPCAGGVVVEVDEDERADSVAVRGTATLGEQTPELVAETPELLLAREGGDPAVSEARGTPQGSLRRAADPHRQLSLERSRRDGDVVDGEVPPGVAEALVLEESPDDLEALVRAR